MCRTLLQDRRGATAVEYALIVSLISVAIIYSVTYVGVELGNTFNTLANVLHDGVARL